MTLILSFVLFPERNELTMQKVVGAAIFFTGLIVQLLGHTKYMQYLCSCSSGGSSSGSGDVYSGEGGSGKLFSASSNDSFVGLGSPISTSDNSIKGKEGLFDLEDRSNDNRGIAMRENSNNLEWEAFSYGQNIAHEPNLTFKGAKGTIKRSGSDAFIYTPKGVEPDSSVYKRFNSSNNSSTKNAATSFTTVSAITSSSGSSSGNSNSGISSSTNKVAINSSTPASYYPTTTINNNNNNNNNNNSKTLTLVDEEETRSDDLYTDTHYNKTRDTIQFLNGDSGGWSKHAFWSVHI